MNAWAPVSESPSKRGDVPKPVHGARATMYEAFFDLKSRPFASTPNTADYFAAASHEDALALLKCFVNDEDGVALVVGQPGIGKTLLGHRLLDILKPNQQPIFLTNTHSGSVSALLQSMLYDLSLPFEGADEQELRLRLTDFLMDRFATGGRTLLVADEAQHLSHDQLEELRLLTNLESRQRKAIQVVLFGQNKLSAMLEHPEMEALSQRIAVVARMAPFEPEETVEYIHACVDRAGGAAESIFTANAMAEIVDRSCGVPRRINQLGHRALLLAYAHQSGTVDAPYVEAAADQLLLPRASRPVSVHHLESTLEAPVETKPPADADEPLPSDAHYFEVGAEWPQVSPPQNAPTNGRVTEPTEVRVPPFPMKTERRGSRNRRLYSD
jgi:type II secretory pathway predicted ATPase ExeA